jgi:DNA-binding response OmpR family regulator
MHDNKAATVLVVEDDAMMRTKLTEELKDAGFSVVGHRMVPRRSKF